jgi:hypothetical protein
MTLYTKIALGSLGSVLVAALALSIGSDGGDDSSPAGYATLRSESRRLDDAREKTDRRIVVGEAIIRKLIDGRVGLAEAARAFLALHEDDPNFLELYLLHHPGQEPVERAARDMAARAHARTSDPKQREQLAARLTQDFQTVFPERAPLEFDPVPAPHPPARAPAAPARPNARPLPVPHAVPRPTPVE